MSRSLHEIADTLEDLVTNIRSTANVKDRTNWVVVRNMVGNLSILDGNGAYVGHIDLVDGDVELVPKAERGET